MVTQPNLSNSTTFVFPEMSFSGLLEQLIFDSRLDNGYKIPDDFWYQIPQENEHDVLDNEPRTARNVGTVFTERKLDMVIFWGSQSGRAEMLTKRLAKTLRDFFGARVYAADLDDFDHEHLAELQEKQLCGFILSSYGDGDPPDNTNGLWKTLDGFQSKNTNLGRLRYVLFGLGNSEYRRYNQVAKHVDEVLRNLGAVRYGIMGDGDDANGMTETSFIHWRHALEETLKIDLGWRKEEASYSPSFRIREDTSTTPETVHLGEHFPLELNRQRQQNSAKYPSPLQVTGIRKLWEDDTKLCLHLEIDLGSNRTLKYRTGDYLAIWPINPNTTVDRLLVALNLMEIRHTPVHIVPVADLGEKSPVVSPTTYDALFRHYLEISAPVSQELLADLASFATSDETKGQLLRLSRDPVAFQSEVAGKHWTVADLLETHNSKSTMIIPFSFFLERFRPMQPRYYSISSSSIVHPGTVSLTVAVNKAPVYEFKETPVQQGCFGLATTYMHSLERSINNSDDDNMASSLSLRGPRGLLEGHKTFGMLRNSTFKLPLKSSTPVIMIGAGTGVAPFRGFVQERLRRQELGQEVGRTLLFIGFRHPDVDFIYKDEWKQCANMLGQGSCKIWTAFSRVGTQKVYVQDRLRENAQEVLDLLSNPTGCRMYICGAAAMARGIIQVLVTARIASVGGGEDQAALWIRNLRSSKQLLEDVWG
ncbi:hypothetical protein F4806DRAFT_472806 [Annulohypoxylon nitens]|nr:hypothetical protein F4806DRAFT_472806 [Annulohypoxylon nitens]